ncbi:MAG: hypothetical protein R2752_13235 [Vicinamibacterales bacterium]
MRVKLITSMLVLAVAAFGAAPCAGMSMDMGARGMDDHCADATHSQTAGQASSPMPPSPADCCAIGSVPAWQTPGLRTESTTPIAASTPDMLPSVPWLAAVELPRGWTASTDPPRPATAIPLHLLLSVLLI